MNNLDRSSTITKSDNDNWEIAYSMFGHFELRRATPKNADERNKGILFRISEMKDIEEVLRRFKTWYA